MKYLVLIGCLLAWGCQTTPQAITDFDPAVDFSRYQTFSWIDPHTPSWRASAVTAIAACGAATLPAGLVHLPSRTRSWSSLGRRCRA